MKRQCRAVLATAAFAASLASGSAALAQMMTAVDCGEIKVILDEE